MKASGLAVAAVVALMAVSGCAAVEPRSPVPSPTSAASGPCLGEVTYPDLPVQELNATLPVAGVLDDFVQYELEIERGSGPCAEPTAETSTRACPLLQSTAENTADVMLDRSPDSVTEAEFSRGATRALSETVTGRTADGGTFQYRMTAWRYEEPDAARDSFVAHLVGLCEGAVDTTFADTAATAVYAGDEPRLVTWSDGERACGDRVGRGHRAGVTAHTTASPHTPPSTPATPSSAPGTSA
ncbi:MAG: hypothetical protein ACTHKX_05720 [Pseudolysinimonas sp.]